MQVEDDVEVGQAEVGVETRTRSPRRASAAARLAEKKVLPTPPLPLVTRQDARSRASRRLFIQSSENCDVPKSRPFSSALTWETIGCSRQARLRPSDLAR